MFIKLNNLYYIKQTHRPLHGSISLTLEYLVQTEISHLDNAPLGTNRGYGLQKKMRKINEFPPDSIFNHPGA